MLVRVGLGDCISPRDFSLSTWLSGVLLCVLEWLTVLCLEDEVRWSAFWVYTKNAAIHSEAGTCIGPGTLLQAWAMTENKSGKALTFKLRPNRRGVGQLRSRSPGGGDSMCKGPEVGRSLMPVEQEGRMVRLENSKRGRQRLWGKAGFTDNPTMQVWRTCWAFRIDHKEFGRHCGVFSKGTVILMEGNKLEGIMRGLRGLRLLLFLLSSLMATVI